MGRQGNLFATPEDDAADIEGNRVTPERLRNLVERAVADRGRPQFIPMDPDGVRAFEEARKLARGSDPSSSHEAAREHVRSGAQAVQKAAVLEALRRCTGLVTSAELAQAAGLDRYMVARRLPDLSRDGKAAQDLERPCRVTGRKAVTWRVRT